MNWFIIIFCLIAICLFVITYYLRLKRAHNKELENFENLDNANNAVDGLKKQLAKHNITIVFKNALDARQLIYNKSNTEYLQNMNQPNLLARGCTSKDELYNKYLDGFDDITDTERKRITLFILDLLDNIKPRDLAYYKYVCYWISRISIAKAKPWLEAGMPHTLESTIIMDADWFVKPRKTTFIHEITHINQRITPFEFEDLYKDLGYIYYSKGIENIKGMNPVIALNRNNPDGLSPNWLWIDKTNNNTWWIGAIFQTIIPSKLTDVNNVALKLERDNDGNTLYYLKQQPTILESLTEFNTFFGNNPNNYHPNEMSAKFNEIYLEYVLGIAGKEKYDKYPGFNIYKKHFEKIINSYY